MLSKAVRLYFNLKIFAVSKVLSLEVKVGQERGVLLQRWQEGGDVDGEEPQVES